MYSVACRMCKTSAGLRVNETSSLRSVSSRRVPKDTKDYISHPPYVTHHLINHHLPPPLQIVSSSTTIMKSLFLLPLLPTSLALVAPLKRLTPDLHPRNAHWVSYECTKCM